MPDASKRSQHSSTLIAACLAIALLACALGWLAGNAQATGPGLPLLAGLAFVIQWLAFIPAYRHQTEHFYDLTGSLTYATVVLLAWLLGDPDGRGWLIGTLVLIWCGRLGVFLFRRVRRDGKDGRFDSIKPNFGKFLLAWTLQGLWVFLTLLAALIAITRPVPEAWDGWALLGALVWGIGFVIEVVADAQKSAFKANPENRGRFITHGLWAWSRHPNYFGEMLLWAGICVIALPTFTAWGWLGLLSPIFVAALILGVSGVPLLERRADDRWGGQADYEAYKAATPVLIPLPPRGPR